MPNFHKRIYVAGHRGMVGAAIMRALRQRGYSNLVTRSHAELDLTDQMQVRTFFEMERIDEIYLAAAKVGGIYANNTFPADFIYQNLMIEANMVHQAWRSGVNKLMFLGSSCIYPRDTEQPIAESALLSGKLEPTNEPYAVAKIAGIKLCESYNRQYGTDFRSVMPTNLYGPGDNYHPENSHVIPALIRRFHEACVQGAEQVVIWGSGHPRRDFLHVDDLAEASLHVMELDKKDYIEHTHPMQSHINVGCGSDLTIAEVATLIGQVTGYQGKITFDLEKPDGTPRKLLDTSRLDKLGWAASRPLKQGLSEAYSFFRENAVRR
jgi:GDP-L-fucose synthase